jgi:hypothetical protein
VHKRLNNYKQTVSEAGSSALQTYIGTDFAGASGDSALQFLQGDSPLTHNS